MALHELAIGDRVITRHTVKAAFCGTGRVVRFDDDGVRVVLDRFADESGNGLDHWYAAHDLLKAEQETRRSAHA